MNSTNIELYNVDSVIIKKDVFAKMQRKDQLFDELEKAKCIVMENTKIMAGYDFEHTPVYKQYSECHYYGEDEILTKLTESLNDLSRANKEIENLSYSKNRLNMEVEILKSDKKKSIALLTITMIGSTVVGAVFFKLFLS